jgi:hypothetical protein
LHSAPNIITSEPDSKSESESSSDGDVIITLVDFSFLTSTCSVAIAPLSTKVR